jgi:ankyrin repeat protein
MLTPKRSIQDLLREECHLNTIAGGDPGISTFHGVGGAKGLPRVQSHLRKENMVPRAIVAIPEENDESRGDDGDGRRRKMAKKRTAQVLDGSADGSGKPAIILPAPMHTTSPGTAAPLFQAEAEHVAVVSTAASGRVDGEGLAASLGSRSEAGDKDEDASSVKSFTEADLDYSANPHHADDEDGDNDEGEVDEDPFQSLPAPHAAAARGDLDRLKVLEALEPSLLTSFDEAQRSPLFYAVAYGHDEVVDYLLNIAPDLSLATDAHGDTPMHAAASAGSAGCLDRLISAAFGEADPRNAMDMSPAHLARNVECLEVLFRHGADLAAVDVNGRSPLFVACAMNREACAEYLIGCLDESETSLLICDKRGDTPLHAAACNGAVDCLLMLLQFGIDPRSTNAVGLKAVDLAIRNKQKKCRELLAEYHLHYCTSSDFDSVLFLKTLEGHRSVKKYEMAMKGQLNGSSSHSLAATADGDSSGLRRVGSHNRSFTGGSSGGGLTRPRSIFSMKNASVRLQRWGSWLSYEDPQTKKEYWYNHRTGVGQFEKPDKVRELQIRAMSLGDDAGIAGASQQQAVNMKLKRKGDWIEYVTEEGKTFFYNEKNGDFSWVEPTFGRAFRAANVPTDPETSTTRSPLPDPESKMGQGTQWAVQQTSMHVHSAPGADTYHQEHNAYDTAATEGHTGDGVFEVDPAHVLHNTDWKPYNDPATGFVFWYNHVTNMSQVR